jgi:hypothetical protein
MLSVRTILVALFVTTAPARSNPMLFEVGGRQRVAMSAGGALFVFGL